MSTFFNCHRAVITPLLEDTNHERDNRCVPPPPTFDTIEAEILNTLSHGVVAITPEHRVSYCNHAAAGMFGITTGDAKGCRCRDLFQSEVCGTEACLLQRARERAQKVRVAPFFISDGNGTRIPLSVTAMPFNNGNGNGCGVLKLFHPIRCVGQPPPVPMECEAFKEIVTRDEKMFRVLDEVQRIAGSSCSVLISGETGTGKELVARAIHALSPRKEKALVCVNCHAIPENLLDSHLFGHTKGSYTGAVSDGTGRFAEAEGGTIFLDEIGDSLPALQAKLLRVLEQKQYREVGGEKLIDADVRVVTATNVDLTQAVRDKSLREDLRFRMAVEIALPPLRERAGDIPLLIDHFIRKYCAIENREISHISPEAYDLLLQYHYPGNVRDLENTIRRAVLLCPGSVIEPFLLPDEILPKPEKCVTPCITAGMTLKEIEKNSILQSLRRNNWHREATARELAIDKKTLLRKIELYKINLPDTDGRSYIPKEDGSE